MYGMRWNGVGLDFQRVPWASPKSMPKAAAGSIRASMHVTGVCVRVSKRGVSGWFEHEVTYRRDTSLLAAEPGGPL